MNALALSRAEFIRLLPTPEEIEQQQRRRAELRRLAECARLAQLMAEIVDRYPGKPYRQVAAQLGPDEGTYLLELIDRLEIESQECGQVQR
jgi:hypothetical protein